MFKGPDGQTGLGPATPTPIETTNRPAQENLANNLYHAVNAAPLLRTMPDLAWAAAHRGGDIANNAQGISTLLLAHHIGNAVASWHEQNPEWLQEFHSNLEVHAKHLQEQQQQLDYSEAHPAKLTNGGSPLMDTPLGATFGISKGLADGLFNIGRGAYKEITPSTQGPTPLTQQIDDFYHHTQLHLEHTVFSPEWWVENSRENQAAYALSHKYETGQLKIPTEPIAGQPQVGPQISGQPLMPQVSGRFGTMALIEGANPNDVARGAKGFLKWVNQEFDTLQHLNRAVHLAYQKEGWAGVGRMLAPGMLAAGLTFLAPEGTPFFGEAAAASAESMVGEAGAGAAEATAEAGGIGARAANAFKAPSNLTAETNAEGAAAAATAPARAGEEFANQTLGRAAAIPKAGMRALNTLTTSPRLLAFQLGPQMYANISSRLHLDPSYSKIWDQTIQANGMLTFGQDLSKALGMGKNSFISGAADAIVSLAEAPMMAGRAGAIEREAADRTLAANTADQVRTMFRSSPRYRRALGDIVKIVKDAPTKEQAVGDITSLYGNFARGVFSDPAIRDEVLKSATSPEELSKALEDIASLHDMKQIFQLPTMGIYGMLKQLKNSDGKIPSMFNHYFAQAPFMTSAEGRASKVLTNELVWGDAKSADMVAQLLRSKGIPASRANLVIGDLLHSASPQEFRNIAANAIAAHGDGIITKRMFQEAFRNAKGEMLKGDAALFRKLTKGGVIDPLGNVVSAKLTKEEIARAEAILQAVPTGKDAPLRQAYDVMRHEWNNLVKTQLGGAWGTPDAYVMKIDGSPVTGGAMTDAQRGFMSLPRFQDFDKMTSEFWKSNKDAFSPSASFRNAFARRALNGNAHINRWLNEMFFKPLALATPGWAMRVSVSEAALNIARQGPGNYVAGRVGNRLETNLSKIGAKGEKIASRGATKEITGEDVANMLGKDDYKVDMKTREAIALFMRGFRVGFDRALLKGLDKEYVANAAVRLAYRHGAYLPDAVDARHGHIGATDVDLPATASSKGINQVITDKKNFGDSFGVRTQGGEGHLAGWQHGALVYSTAPLVGRPTAQAYKELYDSGLRGVELHDAAVEKATSIINGLDPREATQFDRFHNIDPEHDAEKGSLNPKADAVASWAENLVAGLEGVVGSRSGFVNERLLNDIANDQVVTGIQNFEGTYGVDKEGKKLGTLQIPKATAFRDVTFKQGKNGPFAAFTSAMHNKMLGPMVNNLVRKPVYIVEFATERKALESQVAKGILTADQADVLAETYAAQNMVRFIHNPADKTHFEEMMRTAAPFYFAQNQAFRRMGRLFATNPGAFLQYMDAMMGIVNWTNNVTSQNGIGLLNIPSIAMWGIGWTASISSLQSMDPLAAGEGAPNGISPVNVLTDALTPKFGPAITIPTILLNAVAPSLQDKATAKATRFIEGPITGTENVTQQLGGVIMPNSLVRNVTGMILGSGAFGLMKPQDILGYSNTYNQAKIEAFKSIVTPASEQYWNSLPKNMPQDKKIGELTQWVANRFFKNGAGPGSLQDTWDRANNRAMLIYSTKLALGAGSPVSIGVGKYQKNKFADIVNAEAKKNGGDYLKGLEAAERDYPYFFAGFVSSSQTTTGQYVPQTKAIGDFISTHHSLVADHPYGALAYGPPNIFDAGKFDETTHQKLVAAGLRTQDTPDAFAEATQIMLGNITYYNTIKPLYEQYRQTDKSAAYKWKTQVETAYGVLNDPWWQHFNPHESYMNAMRGVSDIQAIMQMPEYRNDPRNAVYQNIMTKGIPILMQYKAEISSGKYSAQSVSNWWNGVMDQVVQNYPDAKAGIDGIFRSLG